MDEFDLQEKLDKKLENLKKDKLGDMQDIRSLIKEKQQELNSYYIRWENAIHERGQREQNLKYLLKRI